MGPTKAIRRPTPDIARTAAQIGRRCLHASMRRHGSPFFALARLSNSRETQHFAKISKLSRVEHSPPLQLIQSSEVLPFAPPTPPKSSPPTQQFNKPAEPDATLVEQTAVKPAQSQEADLLSVGRAILAEKDSEIARLQEALREEQDRSQKREASYALARSKSRERIHRLDSDLSAAKVWKWFSLIVGLSSATYAFYNVGKESGKELGSKALQRRRAAASSEAAATPIAPIKPQPVVDTVTIEVVSPTPASIITQTPEKKSSWPNLFWAR